MAGLDTGEAVGVEAQIWRGQLVTSGPLNQLPIAIEIRNHETAVLAILSGDVAYLFTEAELRRLEFQKWRFASGSPEDARTR